MPQSLGSWPLGSWKGLAAAVIGLVGAVIAAPANAQLVRVGPLGGVSVRLPFVSVDTLPFGAGTRVRAPFTSVNTGFYGLRGPIYGPSVGAHLYRDYPHPHYRSYGGYYHDPVYAVPVEPAVVVPVVPYGHPDVVVVPQPVPSYEVARPPVADDGLGYRSSTSPYTAPNDPVANVALSLRQSAAQLDRALARRPDDADVWRDYLRPGDLVALIDQTISDGPASLDLDALVMNYEGVAGNSELSHIWVLPGFRRTHEGLKQWIQIQNAGVPSTGVPSVVASEPFDTKPSPAPKVQSSDAPKVQSVEAPKVQGSDAPEDDNAAESSDVEPSPFEAPDSVVEGSL